MSSGVILIVDDTPGNLDLLVDILEKHSFDVRVARNGRRALVAAAAAVPDLVMLDINMPEMDGYEVCRRLKSSSRTREIPVIFLSVNDDAVDKVAAFRAGGADYVTKPFQAEEVLARVENQLKIARLTRALVAEREAAIRAREEADRASAAKSTFLASMSHELRTPLNGILGFVQLMERDGSLSPSQRDNLGVISRSGEHLLALINDVLSLSKIEAGQATLTERSFDLHRLLRGLEEMFRIRAEACGLQLIFDLAPTIPRFTTGDDGKLRQILINLLGNAFKFTSSGGIALRAKWEHSVAFFEVEDTGDGIAPKELEQIFEPFVQAEAGARSGEGTGLGLAITQNFVSLMGGKVEVRSELGCGTIFRFHVRLAEAQSEQLASARRVVGLAEGEPAHRILVVDDKLENRQVLAATLPAMGFEVREATNGHEAIAEYSAWSPTLIFMDMHMPELDGYAATREIRRRQESEGAPPAKIVALSASVFERDRKGILEAGCDDFVGKPFRQELIVEKLAEHLGVAFVYAEEESGPSAADPDSLQIVDERFARLDSDHRSALCTAVNAGDREAAYRIADEIEKSDAAVADELRTLIRAYRFDEILALVG